MTSEYVSGMKWPRWALLLFGSISVVAGVMTLMWPGVTILVLVVFLGIDILIWGLMLVTNSFRTGDGRVLGIVVDHRGEAIAQRLSRGVPIDGG